MSSRLPLSRASQLIATRQLAAAARFASSVPKPIVKFDQTKKSNNPDEAPRPGHHEHGTTARTMEGDKGAAQPHPAKQPDPQPSPEKSTGIQPDGPESRAGEGKAANVHGEQLDGKSKEHSLKRPAAHEGTTAGGRGGDAL